MTLWRRASSRMLCSLVKVFGGEVGVESVEALGIEGFKESDEGLEVNGKWVW